MSSQASTLPTLDLLRTFAAWSVVAWHLADLVGYTMPVFHTGAFAVDLFMNISGFLMFYHYVRRAEREPWAAPSTWIIFYVRRIFRIVPLFAVLVLFIVSASPFRELLHIGSPGQAVAYFLRRVSFIYGFSPGEAGRSIMPDWSLTLEMQFYLAFPFLALLVRRVGYGAFFFLCSLVAALACLFISYSVVYAPIPLVLFPQPTLLPLKLQIFAVGIVVAGLFFDGRKILHSKWFIPGILLFSTTCRHVYRMEMGAFYLLAYLAFAYAPTSAAVATFVKRMDTRLRTWTALPWTAELSYSVYLIHPILFTYAFGPISRHFVIPIHGTLPFLAVYIPVLIVLNLIGIGLFRFIEKPAIEMGRHLLLRFKAAPVAPGLRPAAAPVLPKAN